MFNVPAPRCTARAAGGPASPLLLEIEIMAMHLRFKRQRQTVFLHCDPSELVGALKELRVFIRSFILCFLLKKS